MPIKGYTWNEEYRKKFFESEAVREHQKKFIEQASQPKSPTQRAKMSIAKKDKKFTQEHKDNMSEAQKFRQALRKEIETNDPQLSKDLVWIKVREQIKQYD